MQGCDMIVNLQKLPEIRISETIQLKRVFPGDKEKVLSFIREHFSENWVYETECAILQSPSKCFIATENGKILGFACFDATAKGFFGPTGVDPSRRGEHIGQALLVRTLRAMAEYGYGYAIIGWVSDAEHFYRKTVGAEFIKGGEPENSVYANLVSM